MTSGAVPALAVACSRRGAPRLPAICHYRGDVGVPPHAGRRAAAAARQPAPGMQLGGREPHGWRAGLIHMCARASRLGMRGKRRQHSSDNGGGCTAGAAAAGGRAAVPKRSPSGGVPWHPVCAPVQRHITAGPADQRAAAAGGGKAAAGGRPAAAAVAAGGRQQPAGRLE